MANYLTMFSAPKEHIDFMKKHNRTCVDYFFGRPAGQSLEIQGLISPQGWPDSELIPPQIEINDRNVDLYHWILNQTLEPVNGAGSIFQTWLYSKHDALILDESAQHFAFYPEKLPELLTIIKQITPESARESFALWGKENDKEFDDSDLEHSDDLLDEFENFADYLEEAIVNQHGLVWIVT